MIESPKVSFIIPVYNGADYISESVRSACEQDYSSFEVIIINDGSTDGTLEILESLKENYAFKVVSQSNQGVCWAMNKGLELARGEYLCWGGHDDIFYPERIRRHADFLDGNKSFGACYSNVEYIDFAGRHLRYGKRRHLRSGWVLDALFKRNFIPAPAAMVRASLVRDLGGFDVQYHVEDYPFWLKLAVKRKIAFVDAVVTKYRLHDANMSGAPGKFYIGTQKVLEDWADNAACTVALRYRYRRWFCDASKGEDPTLIERYLKKLKPIDFVRPRVLRSYARYLIQRSARNRAESDSASSGPKGASEL